MTPVSATVLKKQGTEGPEVTSMNNDAAAIAGRFLTARRAASGLPDYPGELPATLDEAYAIQDRATASWGKPVIGWKVGRVLPPLSEKFGTDRLAGPIFASDFTHADGAGPEMPVFASGFAAAESEFLLKIGRTPPAGKTSFTLEEAADLIDTVHVGIEIASSPLGAINAIGPIAIVSDFGNNNGLVIGREIENWRASGFEEWPVSTRIDGVEIGTGRASAFPDGAIGSARFLFELMARRGIELRPGQWISSGAVTGVHDARPGQKIEALFAEGYAVRCALAAASPE